MDIKELHYKTINIFGRNWTVVHWRKIHGRVPHIVIMNTDDEMNPEVRSIVGDDVKLFWDAFRLKS